MTKSPGAGACQAEVLLGAAALDRLRIRDPESYEPLLLQSRQSRIHRTNGNGPAGAAFDLAADGDSVRLRFLMREREHHVQFEFPDEVTFGHVFLLQTRT